MFMISLLPRIFLGRESLADYRRQPFSQCLTRLPIIPLTVTSKQEWEGTRTSYQREVLGTFKSDQERVGFLSQHALTYPAGA